MLGNGKALRYGIGVGREGFTWSGAADDRRKAEWPDWTPPAEMIARQPYLPRYMAGGPGNPLGARALYLGRHHLSHSRHQRAVDHRQPRVVGLHPPDQRGRDRPLHRASTSAARLSCCRIQAAQRRDALEVVE